MRLRMSLRLAKEMSLDLTSDDDNIDVVKRRTESQLVYKHNDKVVELHKKSLNCLDECKYLNDDVIQFYFAYLLSEICKETSDRIHIFDTIFYQEINKVFGLVIDRRKLVESRKWYRGINIFAKDFLIVPICRESHWKVAIICYPNAVKPVVFSDTKINDIQSSNKQDRNSNEREVPSIVVMDSLGLKSREVSSKLRDFLDYEWRRTQYHKNNLIKRFSHCDMKDYYPRLPLQTNTYDCGLFMLVYTKCFLENPDEVYELIKSKDKNLKEKIYQQLSKINRDSIRELIVEKTCRDMELDK